jgi:hypothetical protein
MLFLLWHTDPFAHTIILFYLVTPSRSVSLSLFLALPLALCQCILPHGQQPRFLLSKACDYGALSEFATKRSAHGGVLRLPQWCGWGLSAVLWEMGLRPAPQEQRPQGIVNFAGTFQKRCLSLHSSTNFGRRIILVTVLHFFFLSSLHPDTTFGYWARYIVMLCILFNNITLVHVLKLLRRQYPIMSSRVGSRVKV